jgi:hypothetical protein
MVRGREDIYVNGTPLLCLSIYIIGNHWRLTKNKIWNTQREVRALMTIMIP